MQPELLLSYSPWSDLTQTLLSHPGQNQHLGLPLLLSWVSSLVLQHPAPGDTQVARASPSEGSITLPAPLPLPSTLCQTFSAGRQLKTGRARWAWLCLQSKQLARPSAPAKSTLLSRERMCWLMVFQIKLWSKSLPPLQKLVCFISEKSIFRGNPFQPTFKSRDNPSRHIVCVL